MTTNYPALGFDQAPGESGAVTALATNFSTVAQHLGTARDTLNDIGHSDSVWQGDAANNFRGKVGQLPDYLGKANTSLGDAAKALEGWASDLTTRRPPTKLRPSRHSRNFNRPRTTRISSSPGSTSATNRHCNRRRAS